MQFVKNGPDVPEQLLQAHEDGRVVFFCGAGISYPAGLPGFGGLIDKVYDALGTTRTPSEDQAYKNAQYDATLDLLERRFPGQRAAVRSKLPGSLKPNYKKKGAVQTHSALLRLATGRDGAVRLVTTNFDRIFQRVIKREKLGTPSFPAPLLPIPKNSRWNGIVYLHGLLPDSPDDGALQRLVLSSGDFGLAYLTERWAARFVSELFRNYVVCFVGYSIGDPVLRYMMDALAADRMLGEFTPDAYAFGDFKPGEESSAKVNWSAKGVTPILYETSVTGLDHSALHETLNEWSKTYRDGVQGKERIIVDYASSMPLASTQQDDFVGRMLWALSHKSGMPAKRFADFDPVPSLEWLTPLCHERYAHNDLIRFGIPAISESDDKLKFSLTRRPAPYTHAPWMLIARYGNVSGRWDQVMHQLGRWLCRHLNDPALVLWLVERGGRLHDDFSWLVENKLEEIDKLQTAGDTVALQRMRDSAPNSIPAAPMRTLWRLLIAGRVRSPATRSDIYSWKSALRRNGLTPTSRIELRRLLEPQVRIREPYHLDEKTGDAVEPTRLKQIVEFELVLASDNVGTALAELQQSQLWRGALPLVLKDAQQLLRDALDLLGELGEADERSDRSHWDLPSISPHWQNRGFHDWVSLIELCRDSWLATLEEDPERARIIAQDWWREPYSTFKRLALFAASKDGIAPGGGWADWLVSEEAWWLWSVDSQREVMRLLVLRGNELSSSMRGRLEAAILAGPRRSIAVADEHWRPRADRAAWLRLAKLASTGQPLGELAQARLEELSVAYPRWELAENERDEFSHWMSGSGDPDFEGQRQLERAPLEHTNLMDWLLKPKVDDFFYEDDWRVLCRDKFHVAFRALRGLAQAGHWPSERWNEALQVWSDQTHLRRSWRLVPPVLTRASDETLRDMAHSVSWWMEAPAKSLDRHEEIFLSLCRRVLALDHDDSEGDAQPTQHAINHPIGHITQALLNYWLSKQPRDGEGLPEELKAIFTDLCDTRVHQFRHARVLLATHVIALFRVDREWAEHSVLPLFRWQTSHTQARAAWEGFLWSPRLYRPLLAAFRADFLETANHYADLDELDSQYATFLTYVALDRADTFTASELSAATDSLPAQGLRECAQALARALEGSGERRSEYWENRIEPYWREIWPKARDRATPGISEELARLVVAAGDAFPRAIATVKEWLQPFDHPSFIVHRLHESGLCRKHPKDALTLLHVLVRNDFWPVNKLASCMEEIVIAWPEANHDGRYQRIMEIIRTHQ